MEEETIQGVRRSKFPVREAGGVVRIRPKSLNTDPASPGGSERMIDIIDVVCPHCLHRRKEEVPMRKQQVGELDVHECPLCKSVLLDGDKLDIRHHPDEDADDSFIVYDEHGKSHKIQDE